MKHKLLCGIIFTVLNFNSWAMEIGSSTSPTRRFKPLKRRPVSLNLAKIYSPHEQDDSDAEEESIMSPQMQHSNRSPLLLQAVHANPSLARRNSRLPLTPRIQQEMQENNSLKNKALTPRSHIVYDALNILSVVDSIDSSEHTPMSVEHYKQTVADTYVKTFPGIFNTVSTLSHDVYTPDNEATLLLQLGMIKNDYKLVKKAIKQGARPDAQRLPLSTLCDSPDYIQWRGETVPTEDWATECHFKGELVIGLCAILCQAHAYKANKMITDPKNTQEYLENLSKINKLVWKTYEKYTKKANRKNSKPQ